MKNTPTVFVVKEQVMRGELGPTPMDYSPAMQFGDLVFITTHDMPMYGNSNVMASWKKSVQEFAEAYNPEIDLIITTGQPTAIFGVGWALGRVGKIPRFLVWRREENRYRVANFPIN